MDKEQQKILECPVCEMHWIDSDDEHTCDSKLTNEQYFKYLDDKYGQGE